MDGSARWLLIMLLIGWAPVCFSSHFRGAIITWKPGNRDKNEIIIDFRISWRMSYTYTDLDCDANTISSGILIGNGDTLTCFTNCYGTFGSVNYRCTDFSNTEDWSSGRGTVILQAPRGHNYFEFGYHGSAWISLNSGGNGDWNLKVSANLTLRPDNTINSSPVVEIPPVVRLQKGCNHTIVLPVSDPDGDKVRCRWASSQNDECGSICSGFPNSYITSETCEITYDAKYDTGWYGVAVQVEDFLTQNSTQPLSSVPVQFLVYVFQSADTTCNQTTKFVSPTPPDNACIGVPIDSIFEATVAAQVANTNRSITQIQTISPVGMSKSDISMASDTIWQMNITWNPKASGTTRNDFCFTAEDSAQSRSEKRCISLLAGVNPPEFDNTTNDIWSEVPPTQRDWTIQANMEITQTNRNAFIRVFRASNYTEVELIDASDTMKVSVQSSRHGLHFSTTVDFIEKEVYYILFDFGVVRSRTYCLVESKEVTDKYFWRFKTRDITPPQMIKKDIPSITNATSHLSWLYDEPVVTVCQLEDPNGHQSTVQCNNSWTGTQLLDGSYILRVQATDLAGNKDVMKTLTWIVVGSCNCSDHGNCSVGTTVCQCEKGFYGERCDSVVPPHEPPILDIRATVGLQGKPVTLYLSALNQSGSVDHMTLTITGFPHETVFSSGYQTDQTGLVLDSSDFGPVNMTVPDSFYGNLMLHVEVNETSAAKSVTRTGDLSVTIVPDISGVVIDIHGCFFTENQQTAVRLNVTVSDWTSNVSIPFSVALSLPPWASVEGKEQLGGSSYLLQNTDAQYIIQTHSHFQPFNVTVNVSLPTAGYEALSEAMSWLEEINTTCTACPVNTYGLDCGGTCDCNLTSTLACDKFDGSCLCMPGYTGPRCGDDVDECALNTSLCEGSARPQCYNIPGGYSCVCKDGFWEDGDNCTECQGLYYGFNCSSLCPCNSTNTDSCDNKDGHCQCSEGWTGAHCDVDVDECSANMTTCETLNHTVCQNTAGGYDCLCRRGFQEENDTCTEIPKTVKPTIVSPTNGECQGLYYGFNCSSPCPCNSTNTDSCDNKDGHCQCSEGWTGAHCDVDVDECSANMTTCETLNHTVCQNTAGEYDCLCRRGFQEENDTCTEIPKTVKPTIVSPTNGAEKMTSIEVKFNINIPITDNLDAADTYDRYEEEAREVLNSYYRTMLGIGFIRVVIVDLWRGSLYVKHEVVTRDHAFVLQELGYAVHELSQEPSMTFFGQTVSVEDVKVGDVPVRGNKNATGQPDDPCKSFTAITPCGKKENCVLEHGLPTCRSDQVVITKTESKDEDTGKRDRIILMSIFIPVGTLMLIFLVCAARSYLKRKEKKDANDSQPGDIELRSNLDRNEGSSHRSSHNLETASNPTYRDSEPVQRASSHASIASSADRAQPGTSTSNQGPPGAYTANQGPPGAYTANQEPPRAAARVEAKGQRVEAGGQRVQYGGQHEERLGAQEEPMADYDTTGALHRDENMYTKTTRPGNMGDREGQRYAGGRRDPGARDGNWVMRDQMASHSQGYPRGQDNRSYVN